MLTIDDIINRARLYLPEEDLTAIRQASDYAAKIHAGQSRLSGEPFISHPLAVADILAYMRLDRDTLIAGLLHAVLKVPETSEKELEKLFGPDVTLIVKGTTKIAAVQFNSKLAYQAENIRKMLLAMTTDIRVLLVKLAGRLHDMRSARHLPKTKQEEFARETMDLFAPLASRLGIDWMKRELEDLAFSFIHPAEFHDLSARMATSLEERQGYVEEIIEQLHKKLQAQGLVSYEILGRPKHLYSIYRKLLAQNIPLEQVYDKVAFRIIVNDVRECYEVMGLVHTMWQPIASRFKDFISTPKTNMYQSLHTSVVGPHGEFMEIQIRTHEMDKVAKEGIAAHWAYKEGKAVSQSDAKLFHWLQQLIQGLQELQDPGEFLDAVKGELHNVELYVLTPRGEVKELPQGSTPLDFAYSIHTEVGHHCVGAKVNGRIMPLKYQLNNGDLIEIITSPSQHPGRGWLSLVKTSRARSSIRHWLKQDETEKCLKIGREICERELRKHDLKLKKIVKTGHIKAVLKALSCNTLDDLLTKVGSGKITTPAVIRAFLPEEYRKEQQEKEAAALSSPDTAVKKKSAGKGRAGEAITIDGMDGLLFNISKCCMPMPGDEIMGFITSGRGISVHKVYCANLQATDPERWIDVQWSGGIETAYQAQVIIMAQDRKGLLGEISNAITIADANIINLEAHSFKNGDARLNVVLEVKNLEHLSRLLQHVRQLDGVNEAKRV